MKSIRFCLILGLVTLSIFFCSKKNNVTGNDGNKTGGNITVNQTDDNPYGLDSLYVSPNDTMLLKAATVAPQKSPEYEWTVAEGSVIQLLPDAGDSSKVAVVAVGDSGATTTITVKDLANNQQKTFKAKIAIWANMEQFRYIGSLNGHHYFLSKYIAGWAPAETTCEDSHGHLATISSVEENNIVKQAQTAAGDSVWIGLRFQWNVNDRSAAGKKLDKLWTEWVTGEKVTYKNWSSSQPDFNSPDGAWDLKLFACMNATGKWVDERQTSKLYVLEIP